MKAIRLATCLALGVFIANAQALTITFHEDTATALNFEMSNLGPTPGDQDILSPSGTWGIYAFVHQFEPEDDYAEIGAFVKRLLPVSEVVGTDVIFPQIYGLPDFPLNEAAVGEFGDAYTGTFALLPGSGDNAQDWDWVMTIKTDTAAPGGQPIPDQGGLTVTLLALSLAPLLARWRKRHTGSSATEV